MTSSASNTTDVVEQIFDENNPDPQRWRALMVIGIAQLMVVLDASIVNLALPSAKRALAISDANQQWVITAYTLTFGGLLLLVLNDDTPGNTIHRAMYYHPFTPVVTISKISQCVWPCYK